MGDMVDGFRAMKEAVKAERAGRLKLALQAYVLAADRLAKARGDRGVQLLHCATAHFQLKGKGWAIDAYPSTGRTVARGTLPPALLSIQLPEEWTLYDLVDAVIERT